MAESFAANQLNAQSVVTSDTNPSIFEVLAQQSLATGLRRAADYLTKILYTNNSQKFEFLYDNFDEIYLLFDICVQFCHLKAFNASFSEHFYSLKRVSDNQTNRGLNRRQFVSSLVLLTAFPYIKSKFDSLYARLKLRQLESQTTDQSVRQLFVKTYPMIRTFCQLVSLYYEVSYTVGRNRYHSPLLRLSNVRLINLDDDDLKSISDKSVIRETNMDWFAHFARLSMAGTKCLAKGFAAGLSVGAFFIQFLDYWYSTDMYAHSFAPLPVPPPPPQTSDHMISILYKSVIRETNMDWFAHFARLSMAGTKCLAKGFAAGLSVGAFFIQFLDYWYSTDMYAHSFAPLPVPPPPLQIDINVPIDKCPICLRVRQNDTALMTTGFVFCYSCIVNHLQTNSHCPITGYPSTVDHLIKLYPPDQ
ncbi:unnamed protein product [Oppiella nova]|uniref:Peroxisome assembly protein 12 n=1 Tax=Oppiella nova TaxID=334625 RepID=A0A7R9LRK0_9ACAR|nr:unnamed protein product [Oppiella nova]CAG2166274.1 unnamed protein product [Oppiella nova]